VLLHCTVNLLLILRLLPLLLQLLLLEFISLCNRSPSSTQPSHLSTDMNEWMNEWMNDNKISITRSKAAQRRLNLPRLTRLNQWAGRVAWCKWVPATVIRPRIKVGTALTRCVGVFFVGVIILYTLYHNGIVIYNSSSACNVSLTRLETWSAHQFRLETCTAVGCASSPSVLARTQELPPEGHVGLTVNVSSPRTVVAYWTPVSAANGQLRYDVYFSGPFYALQSTYLSVSLGFSNRCLPTLYSFVMWFYVQWNFVKIK